MFLIMGLQIKHTIVYLGIFIGILSNILEKPTRVFLPPTCSTVHVWPPQSTFSSHFLSSLVIPTLTLADDLAGACSLPIHHYSYISLSISDTIVRIKFQIPHPSHLSPPHRDHHIPQLSHLTSTTSMRWWRINTDTWSYSICALDHGPKSIISNVEGWRWADGGYSGCWDITQQERTFQK